ncbi:hypothetical protein VHEMI03219 [[Torrubiella] hemipterigena]|uniref:Uncharacterized protein n=1 Tax=[Torrubiella] hemipterigena TaxID=1531966 RepID=A0A0A1TCV6_9HYPO|nr:hypothetical protein VHEMI03219 [[Torrubiella] hemipterigena]
MKSSFITASLAALAAAAPSAQEKIQAMRLDGKMVMVDSKNPGGKVPQEAAECGIEFKFITDSCPAIIEKAKKLASTAPDDTFTKAFGKADKPTRDTVANILGKMQKRCGAAKNDNINYLCSDPENMCADGQYLWYYSAAGDKAINTHICPIAFSVLDFDYPGMCIERYIYSQHALLVWAMGGNPKSGLGLDFENEDLLKNVFTYSSWTHFFGKQECEDDKAMSPNPAKLTISKF